MPDRIDRWWLGSALGILGVTLLRAGTDWGLPTSVTVSPFFLLITLGLIAPIHARRRGSPPEWELRQKLLGTLPFWTLALFSTLAGPASKGSLGFRLTETQGILSGAAILLCGALTIRFLLRKRPNPA